MRAIFDHVAEALSGLTRGSEIFTAHFAGERSDFVRFNRSAIRQPGNVAQSEVAVSLIDGQRQVGETLCLSGSRALDDERLKACVERLRSLLGDVPEDPFLAFAKEVHSSERVGENLLPPRDATVGAILDAGKGRDLVGIFAQGGIFRGFANSFGQRNWFESYNFNLDASFYQGGDKAVKWAYAGLQWDQAAFEARVAACLPHLEGLERAPRSLEPGTYRAYLAPAAVAELVGFMNWDGFGLRAHRTKQTPFLQLIEGKQSMHPEVQLRDNVGEGVAPDFNAEGFRVPESVTLLEGGKFGSCLVSSRSAKEYEVPTTGAGAGEGASSLDLRAGSLPSADVLEALGDGVYLSNLWYLNHSDRSSFRVTGMTRYACFLVEGGRIAAPLNVMRFDDSMYRIFGSALSRLTAERELILSPSTYNERSTESLRVPGALLDGFRLTL